MKTVKSFSPKTKILSLVLSFLIIFYIVPTSVFAEGLDNGTTVADNTASKNEENTAYAPEIYEVTDLREENVKHFRLADGSYVAAQYNYPVHYTDENGEFEDIDNRLVESGSEFSTGNNSRVKFIKKITGSGNIFTIHENNTKITMGLVGAEKKTKGIIPGSNNSDDFIDDTLGKMTNLENISSTILYEDILDGVDIEYIIHSLNIKENIIVKEKKDNYSYTFTLNLNNLTANLTENGDVHIVSLDGETQYIIPAPVVYDTNGNYAPDNVSAYSLSTTGNGKYELNVTVDSSWMNAEDRAFPVTIDPPMMSSGGIVVDFNIDSESPNTNTNGGNNFYVSSTQRSYLKFDEYYFATIPNGASIMKAELSIISYYGESAGTKVGAYGITSNWNETLTWNKTISASPEGTFSATALDYVVINSRSKRYSWDITELYNGWLNGSPNYGIGLKLVDETATGESAYFTAYEYNPSIPDELFYAPAILVTYIYNDGLESYYPTSTHSAGVGGAGSINLSTGRLTLAIPTLTATDSLFAFTPTLVYNSSLANKPATSANSSSAFSESYMPHGFKLNIQETLVSRYYFDSEDFQHQYYILYDADGSTHRFYQKSVFGPYYDDDGLQLTLTVGTDETTIEDIDHNVKTYTKINSTSWHLTSIADKSGNQLIFEFNESYQPTKVIVKPNGLENIEMLKLLYEGNKLCAVYNDSSKYSVILRYSGNNLVAVQYCYGNTNTTKENVESACTNPSSLTNVTVYATATYSYDNLGNIARITDSDTNKSLQYEITNGKITKLSEYAGTTLGQQLSYIYGDGYTDIRSTGNDEILNTADDIITRHVFDNYGRTVSAYSISSDGTEIYGAITGTYETQENVRNNLQKQVVIGGSTVNYLLNGGFENGTTYWTVVGASSLERDSQFEGEGRYCLEATPTETQATTIKQHLRLRSGSYTLSMLVNSKNCANYTGVAKIMYAETSNILHSEEIPLITESYSGEVSYFTTTFEINSTSEFVAVDAVIEFSTTEENASTEIQIDRVMLDNHIGSADYSLIKHGAFDVTTLNDSSSEYLMRNMWTTSPTIVSSDTPFNNALKITNTNVDSEGIITQRVFEAPLQDLIDYDSLYDAGNNQAYEYILSGFAKSENTIPSSNAKFRLVVEIAYYQGEENDDVTLTYEFGFLPGCKDWQFVCGHVPTVPENPGNTKYDCIRYIDVKCEYSGNMDGYALFDNISLIYATGDNLAKYYYNAKGLLIGTKSYGLEEYYHYDENDCVTKIINNRGEFTEYKYEHTNPLLATSITKYTYEWNSDDVAGNYLSTQFNDLITETKVASTEYTYDSYGLCTSMKLKQFDGNNELEEYIGENYYYITDSDSKIFGALDYSIDSLRNQTSYVYKENGQLELIGYPDHSAIIYTYDEAGKIVKVSPGSYTHSTNQKITYNSSDVDYSYNDSNLLEKITTDSTEYIISYNTYNVESGIGIGDRTLATYEYYPNNGKLKKVNYGNGFSEEYVYNTLEMLSEIWYTDDEGVKTLAYEYEYTSYGQINKIIDHRSGKTTVFRYDINDRLILSGVYDDGEYELLTEYSYDELSRSSSSSTHFRYFVNGVENYSLLDYSYSYNSDNTISSFNALGSVINYSYDNLNRLTSKTIEYPDLGTPTYSNEITYGYYNVLEYDSYYIDEYISKVNGTTTASFTYEYDSVGNITKITDKDGNEVRYYYENLDVLASVEDELAGKKYVYRYDSAGNITSIETRALTDDSGGDDDDFGTIYALLPRPGTTTTVNLSYSDSEWGDLLTSYNGTTITYDEIGNPLSYYNGSAYTFTWEGRRLVGAVKGTNTMSFTYNDEGLRTSKTVNGATTTYLYDGNRLVAEYAPSYTCVYIYDESGYIIGAKYISTAVGSTWQTYFFEKNLQGDVIAIYSDTGTKLISYSYDAWGNRTTTYSNSGASTLAANNRITYRGYYYDTDLEMYYLQSRYYDAKICRFINADSALYGTMLGANLFAYCENNPVLRADPTGRGWFCDDIDLDEDDMSERGGGGSGGYYTGPGSAYHNYAVRTNTAASDAQLGGYYHSGPSSAVFNPNAYVVVGGVTVTDGMATSSNTKYIPPKDGGGITSEININGTKITFGHGGRHLSETNLSVYDVNRAIAHDVVTKPACPKSVGHGTINIYGYSISYNYFTRSSNQIHVGTYHLEN